MRKTALLLGILSMIAIVSCKKKEETPMPTPTETSSETTTTEAAVVSGEAKDSTSIKVSTDGVNVTTKDGASKTTVNVSGGEAKIEVKK
jgi:hypothetical protein